MCFIRNDLLVAIRNIIGTQDQEKLAFANSLPQPSRDVKASNSWRSAYGDTRSRRNATLLTLPLANKGSSGRKSKRFGT
jgi:hypothetical protein